MTFDGLCRRATSRDLAVRGAFQPEPREFDEQLPGVRVGTMVLLGFTGSEQWGHYQRSAEASDGLPHPLDRWSRRVIGALASEFGGVGLYADGTPPQLPFQRLALRSEPVHQSPIGLLIHPDWGLWHAYRGALAFRERLPLIAQAAPPSPCATCADRPCLAACPVGAFSEARGYDIGACTNHLRGAAGAACVTAGCLARRACPVTPPEPCTAAQNAFHMRAFLRAVPPHIHF